MAPQQHNLPGRRKRFIGRTDELARLERYFEESSLVTVTGAGGLGKTRLAMHWASGAERYEHVILIDLARARTLGQLVTGVAEALPGEHEVSAHAERGRIEQLGDALAELGESLVIVDNLEQVVDPAAHAIRRWLDLASEVDFLTTSREPLHLRGERQLRLGPLPKEDAIALFAHRARQVRPEFELDEANRQAVADIVDFLDAVPLAVELAAARINVVAPADILERLTGGRGGLDTLIRKTRHATVRHQSMHATLYWSWELLEPDEREVLAGASVFRGGFDLPAAEAVLAADDSLWVGDVLESLVDKSLVVTGRSSAPGGRGARRFRLFETTRGFADEMLEDERRAELQRRHAQYFADRLTRSKRLQRAEDLDNVEQAFWASVGQDDERAARLALGAYRLGRARSGYVRRQLDIVDAAVEAGAADAKLRAQLLGARARCHHAEGRYSDALDDVSRGMEAADEAQSSSRRAHLLYRKATVLEAAGRPAAARQPLDEALGLAEELSDHRAVVRMRHFGGRLRYASADFEEAGEELADALELARRQGFEDLEAEILVTLGRCQIPIGELESAQRCLDKAGSIGRTGSTRFQVRWLEARGELEWYRGRHTRAFECFERAVRKAVEAAGSLDNARRINAARFGSSALGAPADDMSPEAHLRTVLQTVWSTEDVGDRVQARTRLAIIHLRRSEFREASRLLRRAIDEVERLENGCIRAHVRCWAAVAEAAVDRHERAEQLLDEARVGYEDENAAALDDDVAYFLRAGECLGGRSPSSATESRDIVEDLRTRAKERRFEPAARIWQWTCYDHLIELADVFEGAAALAASEPVLAVARDGHAIRLPDGEDIDLSSRQALQLIVAELAQRRQAGDTKGIAVDELSEVAWPDETLTKSAASSRVYTAIRTLRTMGLEDILLTGQNGYLLDAELPFEWLD